MDTTRTLEARRLIETAHADCDIRISKEYAKNTFILKDGDLEHYLKIRKNMAEVINFCVQQLPQYLQEDSNENSLEVREIVRQIAS